MADCDLLVMVGTAFPYAAFYPDNDIKAIQIDKRFPPDIGLVGDAQPILAVLFGLVKKKKDRSYLESVLEKRKEVVEHQHKEETSDHIPLRPQRLAATISKLADDDAIFVCDTGTVTVRGARNVYLHGTQRFTTSANLGTMAYSMSGALGAGFVYPDRQVIAISGDGSMGMLPGDFITAVKHNLPIKVIVFNNGKLGLIQMEQEAHGFPEYAVQLANPDYADFARCCGGEGYMIKTIEELEPTLKKALASPHACIVDVFTNPEELTMPSKVELAHTLGFITSKAKEFFGAGDKE